MSALRTTGIAILGAIAGAVVGGGLGIGGGLAYTELASVSGFEGYSGFVVAFWMLAGVVLGLLAGVVVAVRLARRSGPAETAHPLQNQPE